MERLWAPWRLAYVQGDRHDGCVFCLGDRAEDRERQVLHRGRHCFLIMNRFPYANGHIMVAPLRHVADPALLTAEEAGEMHRLSVVGMALLRDVCKAQGINVGMNVGAAAGAGIADHLHQHIVPRWSGDTNYMTVVADLRVIPQHLDDTYLLLRDALPRHLANTV